MAGVNRRWTGVVTAAADLALGAECAGCGQPARRLCRVCRARLVPDPEPVDVGPADEPFPVSAAREYDVLLGRVVIAWKERGWTALTPDLGLLLAAAVLDVAPAADAVDLVPVPTSRRNRRRRGRDHAVELAEAAARCLRGTGLDARRRSLLRQSRVTRDQSGLGADEREHNVFGAFSVVTRPESGRSVVVVDDVTTTGATLREARRALEAAGIEVIGGAVAAARR